MTSAEVRTVDCGLRTGQGAIVMPQQLLLRPDSSVHARTNGEMTPFT